MPTKAALALMIFVAVLPAVAAYNEADAAQVRLAESGKADVARVWHEPEVVQPGTQWTGFIEFAANNRVLDVKYQICRVGFSCFAPPTPAQRMNGTTWTFDTNHYLAAGSNRPVSWEAGWRLGMRFVIEERHPNGNTTTSSLPEGAANPDDLEFHYLAFDMPPAAGRSTPALGMVVGAGFLVIAGAWARRR